MPELIGTDWTTLVDPGVSDSTIACQSHPDNTRRLQIRLIGTGGDPVILTSEGSVTFDYKQVLYGIEARIDLDQDTDSSGEYDSSSSLEVQQVQIIY